MKNFWYVAGFNEILVDIDRPHLSANHAESRILGAIKSQRISIHHMEIHASFSESHLHCRILLNEPMGSIERAVWAIIFHSDIFRGCSTIMRNLYGVRSPDLLITPIPFMRDADATCECDSKHNAATMNLCPAAMELRGVERTRGFFGLPDENQIGRIFAEYYERAHASKTNYTWKP